MPKLLKNTQLCQNKSNDLGSLTTFCQIHGTQILESIQSHSTHTCEEYVTYIPKIEENTIKIGHFRHKCRYSTFIITEDGYRHRVWKDSVKVIISLNLSALNIKTL